MQPMLILAINLFCFFLPIKRNDVPETIYEFKVPAISSDGGFIDFSKFHGKMILIVNTASQCVNTPQFIDLEDMYRKHHESFVVVGFPSNDFGQQDPEPNKDIALFCSKIYNVTFPMAAKIHVKGNDMTLIYKWLTEKRYNHFMDKKVTWNFQKYLIDTSGQLIHVFEPRETPKDVQDWLIGNGINI